MISLARFRKRVYEYYHTHPRLLRWRTTRDPYKIFVSEIMLQQTQVKRVLEYYPRFIKRFPDFATLARARFKSVLFVWQGLGYNRRARYLHESARIVVRDYNGVLPRDRDELASLPGIGPATAGSIAAFAFNMPVTFIETNIRSVFIHHFFPGKKKVSDSKIMPLIVQTLDRKSPREWYWALMDYGVHLKQMHPNPSRKSSHHTIQSRFKGSNREIRGLILKTLVQVRAGTKSALINSVGKEKARVNHNLRRLIAEGMVIKKGKTFMIA